MGAYLSEPVTEKISSDDDSERVRYGASSMQGWRISQEDAHNCMIDFDKNMSLFAVYDGHGGHEVATYCSQKLPEVIKETEAYKNGDLTNALIDAFLEFDATIATREVVATLKEIAGVKDNENEKEIGSEDEENVNHLYEEASMPIEQVMEKYQSNLLNPYIKKLQSDKCPTSPMLKSKKNESSSSSSATCSSSSTSSGTSSSKNESDETSGDSSSSKKDLNDQNVVSSASSESETTNNGEAKSEAKDKQEECSEITTKEENEKPESKTKTSGEDKPEPSTDIKPDSSTEVESKDKTPEPEDKTNIVNGEAEDKTVPQANGEVKSPKGKGKAILKKSPKPEPPANIINLRARNARQLYSKLLEIEEESDTEDENDESFDGSPKNSSGESGEESSEDADDEDEGDDDENDDDNEEENAYKDEDTEEFTRNMTEEPGSDSGCTAVVALIHGNELFVANAGDSRCIVCRNGQAVDMSFDHKPEDEPEMSRIVKAGGKVTLDGRVNGGLNLSRAIGDHAYKQNKDLSPKEQMITALPDVKTLTINPSEDEFMVLACDGIWNYMSSQEVVDFVKPRLNAETGPEKLSQICEEMFDHCLAPNTMGDGTGCDNMTAVIVQFKNGLLKRSAPLAETEETCAKKAKTE